MYVRYWSPFGKDMTRIANTIADTVRYGLRRLWWENQNTVVCPINSNIISLINKVIHDYRLHRNNDYHNFWNEWYEKFRGEYALGDSHVLACNLGLSVNKQI